MIKTIVTSHEDFLVSLARNDALEGFYSKRSGDLGGETYRGVARVPNPNWEGWVIIDSMKFDSNFPDCLRTNAELGMKVEEFYLKYWQACGADCISDAVLRDLHFETSVNIGINHAIRILQLILRALDSEERTSLRLKVDGNFGDKTYTLLVRLTSEKPEQVHRYYKCGVFGYYSELVLKDPTQIDNFKGWVRRLELT